MTESFSNRVLLLCSVPESDIYEKSPSYAKTIFDIFLIHEMGLSSVKLLLHLFRFSSSYYPSTEMRQILLNGSSEKTLGTKRFLKPVKSCEFELLENALR